MYSKLVNKGTGLGNKLNALAERNENLNAVENWNQRVKDTGRFPGTHTLGVEFKTTK